MLCVYRLLLFDLFELFLQLLIVEAPATAGARHEHHEVVVVIVVGGCLVLATREMGVLRNQ